MSSNQTTAARPRPLEGAQPHASRNSRRDGRAVGRPFTVSTPMTTPPDPAGDSPDLIYDDDYCEPNLCQECGGEGFIEYNDAGPSYWGEDCPSEENHLVTCRHCRGTGVEP